MSTIETNFYSGQDMQCPGSWYGGFKEARVMQFGTADRALSNRENGEWTGSTFSLQLSDYDRSIRERLASTVNRYWLSQPLTVRMTSRANRAALGTPYTAFVGPIIDAKPTRPLCWDLTLGDIISHTILYDQGMLPWRLIRDGFLDQLSLVSEHLDSETPEPIIYGVHRRVPNVDPPSPQGFCVVPTYLGIMDVSGDKHIWLLAGHACADLPDLRVDDVSKIANEGSDWYVPHHAGWTGLYGTPYVDFTSSTYGVTRRYTLILGTVTDMSVDPRVMTDPDACAAGHKVLSIEVEGIEPNADGTGDVITDRIQQYKHFCVNFVASRGPEGYQSGAWLDGPSWALFDGDVPVVEEASFDACTAIGEARLPGDTPGYIGAAIVGARAGDRSSVRKWLAAWNRSCGVQFGVTHFGQIRICMLAPTDLIKAEAPLVRDATDILVFDTDVQWDNHANSVPWRCDYNHSTGVWYTTGIATNEPEIANYGKELLGEQREYPFAPGETAANHLAQLDLKIHVHPPRLIVIEAPLVDELGDSLADLDLGDYIRYQHFANVGTSATQIRLAQIVRHQVQVGARRVRLEVFDCDDLIGYDMPDAIAAEFVDPVTDGGAIDAPFDGGATGAEILV